MTIGAFYFYPRYFGAICNCCYACCHFSALSAAISLRYSPIGALCAVNVAPSTYNDGKWSDSTTYKSDAGILAALGGMQFILWCCQCYVCCIPCLMTPIAAKKVRAERDD